MDAKSMHYDFKLKMDRVDTLSNPNFNVAEIDWLLNEAQLVFAKQRYGTTNNKRQGFETSQKRIHDLATLHIKFPDQPAITTTLDSGVYEADLSDLDYDCLVLLRADVNVVVTEDCTKKVPLKFVQSDDLAEALKDPFNKSSLDYVIYNIGRSKTSIGTSLYLYPGNLTLDEVFVEYLKYPSRISYGGYTYIDGAALVQANCELPEQTHSEIVDIAVQLAALNVQNPEFIQLKNLKLSIQE